MLYTGEAGSEEPASHLLRNGRAWMKVPGTVLSSMPMVETRKRGMHMTTPFLSVGLIVKNEIRCIEKCLKALQPLRDALPCEVIVADTGLP